MVYTTIRIRQTTAEKLRSLKAHPNQSYDELINSLTNKKEENMEPDIATAPILPSPATISGITLAEIVSAARVEVTTSL